MTTRFVYFDVGDTLLEKPGLMPAIQQVLQRHGVVVDDRALRRAHFQTREERRFPDRTSLEFFRAFNVRFLSRLGIAADDALSSELFHKCKNLPWRAFDDVEAIGRLSVPFGILSNWDSSLDDRISTLLPYAFQVVLGSQASGVAKPDPAFFRLAAERVGLSHSEILFVGDSLLLDIRPALALGARALFIDRFGLAPEFTGERVTSLHQVKDMVAPHG